MFTYFMAMVEMNFSTQIKEIQSYGGKGFFFYLY